MKILALYIASLIVTGGVARLLDNYAITPKGIFKVNAPIPGYEQYQELGWDLKNPENKS